MSFSSGNESFWIQIYKYVVENLGISWEKWCFFDRRELKCAVFVEEKLCDLGSGIKYNNIINSEWVCAIVLYFMLLYSSMRSRKALFLKYFIVICKVSHERTSYTRILEIPYENFWLRNFGSWWVYMKLTFLT